MDGSMPGPAWPEPPEDASRAASLVGELSDVVYVLRLEPDDAVEFLSPSIREFVGRDAEQFYADAGLMWSMLDPRDWDAAARARDADVGEVVDFTVRYKIADGRTIWTQHRSRKDRRADGSIVLCGVARDVTGQRQAQDNYRLLAENASDIVLLVRSDGTLEWVSPSVARTLGWQPDNLIGTQPWELIHPDDQVAAMSALAESTVDGVMLPAIEVRVKHHDGSFLWMSALGHVIEADRIVVGFRDVNDQVRAREAMASSQARLQATIDSLLDPHVLLHAIRDREGVIVDFVYAEANDAASEYMQMSREDLLGATLLGLLPGQAGSGMLAMYASAVESGQALRLHDYAYPHEILANDRRYDISAVRVADGLSFTWRDVTDRYREAARLAESEEKYRLLAENSSDVIMRSRQGMVLWISPSLERALGWAPPEWIDRDFFTLIHPDDVEGIRSDVAGVYDGRGVVLRFRVTSRDGAYHWVESHAEPYRDADGTIDGVVSTLRVVDETVAAEQELDRRATYDDLTGLLRRQEAIARLANLGRRVRRSGDEYALVFCDIDDFKTVNDTRGHAAGDQLMRTFASRIRSAVRVGDTVARMGGDEFLVVLDGVHDLAEATAIAEKIRMAVAEPDATDPTIPSATLSLGVTLSSPGEPVDAMIARADRAMYGAKQAGRNRVVAVPAAAIQPEENPVWES
jgi:diguanylate cyclase (GGDEF)-like protein/PAS domain S-box-containing protein